MDSQVIAVDLREFMAPDLKPEGDFSIEGKLMVWINAGTGTIQAMSASHLALQVHLQIFGMDKTRDIQLSLGEAKLDESDGVISGPCTFRAGRHMDGDARYWVRGETLSIAGKFEGMPARIEMQRDGTRTRIDLLEPKKFSLRFTA